MRPATIPADVAVAVHPDDERYKHLIGREVIVPWTENRVPVIADERVEVEFGTGALKITPAHDPTDFEIGRDHDLPEPSCIGPDGRSTAVGLEGLTQDEAGAKILDWCRERDLLEKREHYRHSVAFCERCHSRIEPLHLAAVVVLDGRDQAAPARGAAQRRDPLPPGEPAPLRDRLARERAGLVHLAPDLVGPPDPGVVLPGRPRDRASSTEPAACADCGSSELTRETDVLDTWFSSALWPFATLGWPEQTPELAQFYPGNVNTTARDIIRLWENRMIFSGLELMGEIGRSTTS